MLSFWVILFGFADISAGNVVYVGFPYISRGVQSFSPSYFIYPNLIAFKLDLYLIPLFKVRSNCEQVLFKGEIIPLRYVKF